MRTKQKSIAGVFLARSPPSHPEGHWLWGPSCCGVLTLLQVSLQLAPCQTQHQSLAPLASPEAKCLFCSAGLNAEVVIGP